MNLEEQAQTWVRWSKDNLPEAGGIPIIGETGFVCPWRTDIEAIAREYCSQFDDAPQECPEPWASYFVRILNDEPEDVAARFTFLDLYQAMIDTGILPDDNYCQLERAEDELQLLIDALPVEDCPANWRNVSWEISNAAVVSDWQRAIDLFRRAEDLRLLERADLGILRGSFIFGHVFGWLRPADGSRPSLHLDRGNEGFESSACLCDGQQFFDVHDERDLTDSQTEMLRIAARDLNSALAERPQIAPAYRAMLARCLFSLRKYRDAAYHYEQFLACDWSPPFRVVGDEPDKRVMQTIAKCYQRAGDVGEAKLFLEKCLAKYPDGPGLNLQMAELCAQEADYRSAYDCLRKEVEVNPAAETDLGIRLGLALGDTPPREEDIFAAVEKQLLSNPILTEQLESVVEVHWPTFASLSDMARDSWACGTYMMLLPYADPKARQNFRRGAAAKFSLAVEIEMRERVFSNFQQHIQRYPELTKLDGLADKDKKLLGPFADFLLGKRRFGLGEMITVLDKAQKSEKRLFEEFGVWVNREFPDLAGQISNLYQIRDFRNPEAHGRTSSADPERSADFCRQVLDSFAAPRDPARA